MSCHFVFTEAWLMNFNRWFLCAFTRACVFYYCLTFMPPLLLIDGQTEQSCWFMCSCLCIGWREVTSGWISDTGTICNSVVNQCNSFASEANGGLWRRQALVTWMQMWPWVGSPPVQPQKGQALINSRSRLSHCEEAHSWQRWPFALDTLYFFLRHAWSSLCGVKRSPRATLLAFNGHHQVYLISKLEFLSEIIHYTTQQTFP